MPVIPKNSIGGLQHRSMNRTDSAAERDSQCNLATVARMHSIKFRTVQDRTAVNQPPRLRAHTTEAILTASRALLGVVAQSVSPALEFVTLPQFRVLVVLTSAGPLRMGSLAERMGANSSTFSRSIDRMVVGGWVERGPSPDSRREVLIRATESGRALVDEVTARRRHAISDILAKMTPPDQESVVSALEIFADAASEPAVEDLLILGL